MIELLAKAKSALQPLGYSNAKRSFWKVEDHVYRLVDFQAGAYGGYFLVNLAVHPVGLPRLIAGRLLVPDQPSECECVVRVRLEDVPNCSARSILRSELVSYDDSRAIDRIVSSIRSEGDEWLDGWGSLSTLANASDNALESMLTVVPVLKPKAASMLRFYSYCQMGEIDEARKWLARYNRYSEASHDFTLVDRYLESLLPSH